MNLPFPPRPCPSCAGLAREQLYAQRFRGFEGRSLQGYDLVVCESCGFVFADRVPDAAHFRRYYAEMSKYEAPTPSEWDLARLGTVARWIAEQRPDRDTRVLEVGCATGTLLGQLRALGYHNLSGLEPSPACVARGVALGERIELGTLDHLRGQQDPADLLVGIGVAEHLLDPVGDLSRALDSLGEGCALLLEVPNAGAFADWPNAPYQQLSVEHLSFYTRTGLTRQLAAMGFRPVAWHQGAHRCQQALFEPVLLVLAVRDSAVRPEHDDQSRAAMLRYLEGCREQDALLREKLASYASLGPLYVWGAGSHTLRLLHASALAELPIVAFIDRNPHYQGQTLAGRPILPPDAIQDGPPILVSSFAFQHAIATQMREELGLSNPLLLLYDHQAPADHG